ncbi:hypothetical protein B0H14DRAFT_3527577 [Mycena olivaceomarginata]|nr:hypothetical protein B0H14DRAFT_3527577 [Mycena olivaceomarginata]
MSAYNWCVPGIMARVPASKEPLTGTPMPWSALTFDPVSHYDLHRHLGARIDETGQFMASIDKFIASDVTWLAGGASTNGQHAVDPNLFFKEFDDLRNATPSGTAGPWGELTRKVIHDLDQYLYNGKALALLKCYY